MDAHDHARREEHLHEAATEAVSEAARSKRAMNDGIRRMLVVAFGAVFFLGIGSLIRPQRSEAEPVKPLLDSELVLDQPTVHSPHHDESAAPQGKPLIDRTKTTTNALAAPAHPHGLPVLGHLRGVNYITWIYGSDDGARYTVCDLKNEVLLADMDADQVYREFPGLDIKGMILPPDAGEPLMLHEDRN